MAKQMVYFNASKQIETITIHYNDKIDGSFVNDVCENIKNIAKKMGSKVNLKDPREYYRIQVFVYPSKALFNGIFGGEIEKRFYARRRSIEDMYIVKDSDGNIHIVSPKNMGQEKTDALKRILVIKVLGEYMDEKQKQSAEKLLKASLKPKEEKEVEEEKEEKEQDDLEEETIEEEEQELDDEELEELIETEQEIEEIDEERNEENIDEKSQTEESENNKKDSSKKAISDETKWLSIGWLAYVRGKLKKKKDVEAFAKNISKNGVKKLNSLSNEKLFENYSYSEEYACAIVDYVVTTYGMKKFVEFYENPKDIKGTFGVSKFVFYNSVKRFIKSKYSLKNVEDSNMLKDEADEITNEFIGDTENKEFVSDIHEVHFDKSGGAEISDGKQLDIDAPIKE